MSDYQPQPPTSTPYTGSAAPAKTPILSILSLIGGILGILTSFFWIGLLFGAAGAILGFIGRRREPQARGLALAGIITGIIGFVISLVVIIAFFVLLGVAASQGAFNSTAP
ncbi:DUF4190 domain-containing protein [Amnibacterium kyonggiense]|uniref:DUF4190 domain-containing protein n=1 Tax=Amnibacterium kyonggiense TaxID=595671 RepID=A0A4R7FQY0_9MICO|nr:DUF4190 domain-containing protein [Amnibacterium kyonggiense]TDS80173.1 hypothetical protein CLV52_0727 [Amnibacterium kyonggiense]